MLQAVVVAVLILALLEQAVLVVVEMVDQTVAHQLQELQTLALVAVVLVIQQATQEATAVQV